MQLKLDETLMMKKIWWDKTVGQEVWSKWYAKMVVEMVGGDGWWVGETWQDEKIWLNYGSDRDY